MNRPPLGVTHHAVERARILEPDIQGWRDVLVWWEDSSPLEEGLVNAVTQRRGEAVASEYRLTPCGRGILVHSTLTSSIVTVLRLSPLQQRLVERREEAEAPASKLEPEEPWLERALRALHLNPHEGSSAWPLKYKKYLVRLDRRGAGWWIFIKGPNGAERRREAVDDQALIKVLRGRFVPRMTDEQFIRLCSPAARPERAAREPSGRPGAR